MNYLKKALERRLRAKIALKANYGISDAHAVCEFVKNGTPIKTSPGFVVDEAGCLYTDKNITSTGFAVDESASTGFVVTDKHSTKAKLKTTR